MYSFPSACLIGHEMAGDALGELEELKAEIEALIVREGRPVPGAGVGARKVG